MPLLIWVAVTEVCVCPARVGLACGAAHMLAVGMDRKDSGRAWLTTKLAHQTFELSNAVAIPRALVNIWVISRNEEDGLERVVKEGTREMDRPDAGVVDLVHTETGLSGKKSE